MGAETMEVSPPLAEQEDDMSDEKMQELLQQAADRIRSASSLQIFEKDDEQKYRFPRLDVGEIPRSFVNHGKGGIVEMDKSARHEKNSKLSGQVRKVEDPLAVRNREAEVRISLIHCECCL